MLLKTEIYVFFIPERFRIGMLRDGSRLLLDGILVQGSHMELHLKIILVFCILNPAIRKPLLFLLLIMRVTFI